MAFSNSSSPAYKKVTSPNAAAYAASSNGLASMFSSLLGGTAPAYKTLDGQAGRVASPSSGLLRIFVGSPPSYRTVESVTSELADDDSVDIDEEHADDACVQADTVVLL